MDRKALVFATIITTRSGGSSYKNRVELQNGCLSRGHSNTFIPSTIAGSNIDRDTGALNKENFNMNMAVDAYISRVDGCLCGNSCAKLPVQALRVSISEDGGGKEERVWRTDKGSRAWLLHTSWLLHLWWHMGQEASVGVRELGDALARKCKETQPCCNMDEVLSGFLAGKVSYLLCSWILLHAPQNSATGTSGSGPGRGTNGFDIVFTLNKVSAFFVFLVFYLPHSGVSLYNV